MPSRQCQCGDYWRMVGRLWVAARRFVDKAACAGRDQRCGQQDMIDAQARVAAKGKLTVVPPTEGFRRLLEQAESILESQIKQCLKSLPFGFGDQNLIGPFFGVVYVCVSGRDVVVAQHGKTGGLYELGVEPVAQGTEPVELIGIFVAVQCLAVGAVSADKGRVTATTRRWGSSKPGMLRTTAWAGWREMMATPL